jgi:hypothetical protein
MAKFYEFNGVHIDIEEIAAFYPLYGGKLHVVLRGGGEVDVDLGKTPAEAWLRELTAQLGSEGKFPIKQ